MTTTQQIQSLIKSRNNGDTTAQTKIDALFSTITETAESKKMKQDSLVAQANALAMQG